MRNFLLTCSMAVLFSTTAVAQVSEAGIPFSAIPENGNYILPQSYLPKVILTAPDILKLQREDANNKIRLKPLRIGALVPADISFPQSGSFSYLPDGKKIWRLQISIDGAKALGLYYDKFILPHGVKYYLSNAGNKQVLGAYTESNNSDGDWATEKVQGNLINIELDLDAEADQDAIQLHINNVCDFYKAIDYLQGYGNASSTLQKATTLFAYGGSSPCEVNAICPDGSNFPDQRKATLHIEYASGGFAYAGSGTLMNNANQDCTPYVLTASHVESTNSTTSSTFSNWIFYFNYETPTCTYTSATQPNHSQTVVGANFKARSSYNSSSDVIVGDFLLIQLKTAIPITYDAYLSGWDHSGTTPTGSCISFHHPLGDVKKLSIASQVLPNGNFNGGQQNSHWYAFWTEGGTEEGSSGSGLFDANGRLIGDLSGGATSQQACIDTNSDGDEMASFGDYSKISLNWAYTYQTPSSSATRLKDWLDPASTGVTTLDAHSATCTVTGISNVIKNEQIVSVYPNPAEDYVFVKINSASSVSGEIQVLNILGAKEIVLPFNNITNRQYQLDISSLAAGVYFIHVSTGDNNYTQKIFINK